MCLPVSAFIETDRFLGNYTQNPLTFKRLFTSSSGDKVYIKNVELTLNGKPITSLNSSATEHSDMMSFVRYDIFLKKHYLVPLLFDYICFRFNYYTQYLSSPYTNSISYKDYLSGK